MPDTRTTSGRNSQRRRNAMVAAIAAADLPAQRETHSEDDVIEAAQVS